MVQEVLNLIECGITWQGEGPDSGKRMLLIRFKVCDRNCPYCDTKVKMRSAHEFSVPLNEIQKEVDTQCVGIMITGGEPLFNLNFTNTMKIIEKIDCPNFNIETNGLMLVEALEKLDVIQKNKPDNLVKFILSPKLFSHKDLEFYINLVNKINNDPRVYIKLVYEETEFNNEFLNYVTNSGFYRQHIYLMPEGKTREELLQNSPAVFDMAERCKVNFSSRDHIIYNFI